VPSNLERYREDLKRLIGVGEEMDADLQVRAIARKKESGELKKQMEELKTKVAGAFEKKYQSWYTEGHAVVGRLIPDRVAEFRSLYESDSRPGFSGRPVSWRVSSWSPTYVKSATITRFASTRSTPRSVI
jgi:hypothetical protein